MPAYRAEVALQSRDRCVPALRWLARPQFRPASGARTLGSQSRRRPPVSMPSMRASIRAASPCEMLPRYATSEIGSPPLSPVAKSAQRPVAVLTLNDPRLRSERRGFSATSSRPTILPPGRRRARTAGNAARAARLISATVHAKGLRRLANATGGARQRQWHAETAKANGRPRRLPALARGAGPGISSPLLICRPSRAPTPRRAE
jgi:hypothetical protein